MWFEMKLQLTIIALALISIAIPTANASHPVPFDDWIDHDCETLDDGTFRCDWTPGSATGLTEKDQPKADEPDTPTAPMPEEDQGIPTVIKDTTPPTPAEREIIKLQKQLEKDGYLPSHEDQLLRALLSLKEACEYGTEEAAPIQNYELFYIATFEPYTHTDLGTQYLLKKIETEIQNCYAIKTLKQKVLGPQYLHIPGKDDVKAPHIFRSDFEGLIWDELEGLDNPTYAFNERHMTAFNFDKSKQVAGGFQCSIEGKQQGHCIKAESDQPIPKPTISPEGKAMLKARDLWTDTGEAALKERMKQLEAPEEYVIQQYMRAYGLTADDLRALADKIESKQ